MKKTLAFAFCLLGILGLSGCGSQSSVGVVANAEEEATITLRFAYASNSQPVIDAMNKFGELVEEKTAGSVKVKYFPDGQLGGERELIELTQSGAIDFTKVSASALESFSKVYSIFSVPYLFNDEQHFFNVMENEEIMQPIYQSTTDLGFSGLTYYDSGQRSFYMVDGPIHTPDDLKGKKIRVMQSETAIRMVELLGGSPVPMGSDEVYTSLQSNLINGSENNEFVLYTAGHGGVAKYYSYDEHTRVPDIIIMNDAIKERLTAEQQQAIEEAAKESTIFEIEAFAQAIEEEKRVATEEYGVQFNEVDNTPFREAVAPLHDEFKNHPDFQTLYRMISRRRGVIDEKRNQSAVRISRSMSVDRYDHHCLVASILANDFG
ncbi:TRAP dicarboxylate transporter subunit DctP [Enterococcus mundtii]|uniref:TRAP dicarboxylate transporter subunit DctP n=1 Tax=Enterococcus mundtii TaxID=53346 RepID=A0A242KVQ8_ENTMU|nr:TRAP dicarboxylate transporter subunit DctP [Enterococcus mundtii]